MAKTKHEILATAMSQMLIDIDQFIEKGRRCLQLVQCHFHAKVLPLNVPPPPADILKALVKPYVIGMSILAPSEALRQACALYPAIGAILCPPFYLKSQCPCIPLNAPFATWWAVKVTLPGEMETLIKKGYWDTLLYCPKAIELSNEIDWFEKEDYTNTLSYTMRSAFEVVERENAGKAVIRKNLSQLALPHFRSVVERWTNSQTGHDTILKNLSLLFTKPFAPIDSENLDDAYAKVRRSLRERGSRNYEHLQTLWKNRLEALIFSNVNWTGSEKEAFLKEWELNLFGCPIKRPELHEGRWDQDMAVDRPTAGKLLKHFIDRFLTNPSKQKKDGEIACLLWVLIWLSQDPCAKDVVLTRVLAFDTTAVDRGSFVLIFDEKSIEISEGLHQLLSILQGKSEGKRRRRLFENLSSDYIQHAMKKASIALFGSEATPILPGAFLSFPHAMEGTRLFRKRRERLSAVDVRKEASFARHQILKAFRENQVKAPSPSP